VRRGTMTREGITTDRMELEKILMDKEPKGPYCPNGNLDDHNAEIVDVYDHTMNSYEPIASQLNRAFQLGRWMERSESQPPLGQDSDYQPICKFCGEKVDEMVMVHFKHSSQRMCVKCMNDRGHRKL
jgi:hypothetical protein